MGEGSRTFFPPDAICPTSVTHYLGAENVRQGTSRSLGCVGFYQVRFDLDREQRRVRWKLFIREGRAIEPYEVLTTTRDVQLGPAQPQSSAQTGQNSLHEVSNLKNVGRLGFRISNANREVACTESAGADIQRVILVRGEALDRVRAGR